MIEMIRNMRDISDLEESWEDTDIEMAHGMAVASIMNDAEATVASTIKSEDLHRTVDSTSIKFKYADGRSV